MQPKKPSVKADATMVDRSAEHESPEEKLRKARSQNAKLLRGRDSRLTGEPETAFAVDEDSMPTDIDKDDSREREWYGGRRIADAKKATEGAKASAEAREAWLRKMFR